MSSSPKADTPTAPRDIRTARLVLSPPVRADLPAITAACQDQEIQEWTTVPSPYEATHADYFLAHVSDSGWLTGKEFTWAIRLPSGSGASAQGLPNHAAAAHLAAPIEVEEQSTHLVGMIGLVLDDATSGEIGYWMVPEARGRGYVLEAKHAVVDIAFEMLGLQRLVWHAYGGNFASAAVARACGFRFEGVARLGAVRGETRRDDWSAGLLATDDRPRASNERPSTDVLATWPALTFRP